MMGARSGRVFVASQLRLPVTDIYDSVRVMVSGSFGYDLERFMESIGNPERYGVALGSNAAVCCRYRSTRLRA